MSQFSAILFFSTNYSIQAAKVLKKANIANRMIPIPRHLSSDCGYCVRILTNDKDNATRLLSEHSVEYDRIEKIE